MTSRGEIPLKRVWEMLERCAPGHTVVTRVHYHLIRYRERSYPALPLGKHGKRENPPIEIGHIRKMVRQLEIDPDCARQALPQLG